MTRGTCRSLAGRSIQPAFLIASNAEFTREMITEGLARPNALVSLQTVGAYAPLDGHHAPAQGTTVSRLYPCVPKALATSISKLRSCSDARYLQAARMEKQTTSFPERIRRRVHTRDDHRRPCPTQCAGIIANNGGAYAPLGGDHASPQGTTVSRLYPCVPKARATSISRLRSCSDARCLQVARMKKTNNQLFGTHPMPRAHMRLSQKALPDPIHGYYCERSWYLRAPGP